MRALILDTETTDITTPEVLQLAYMGPLDSPYAEGDIEKLLFKASKPISLGAMSVHHIIDEDCADYPLWPGSWPLPEGVEYIAAHNADFDWKAIGSPNVKRICTLALSRSVWPDIDSHSLGALTYYLNDRREAQQLLKGAHDAATDVELCCRLLVRLVDALGTKTWPDLWAASEKARVPERLSFGKYGPHEAYGKSNGGKGMRCAEVRRHDPGYHSWLMAKCDQVTNDPYLQKALRGETA